ncbi:hypothetical protein KCU78_g4045, partial [Aureobasidium melanogenum]
MRAADPAAYQALMEKFEKGMPANLPYWTQDSWPHPPPPSPASTSATTTAWLSAVEALEAKNNNLDKVLEQLETANQQVLGHLQHAYIRQEQTGEAILGLKQGSADMKKAIETLKKQQQFEIVLGKLEKANGQVQGHLQHAYTLQEQTGEAIKGLQKDTVGSKKPIEDLKRQQQQQMAGPSTPIKSKTSGLRSIPAIKGLQEDIAEDKRAIEDLKKQQVAAALTPSNSKLSSLQSLSGGILGAQTSIPSDASPFDN